MKKITAFLSAAVLTFTSFSTGAYGSGQAEAADIKLNYAEALQKSIYFYECQQAGLFLNGIESNGAQIPRSMTLLKEDGMTRGIMLNSIFLWPIRPLWLHGVFINTRMGLINAEK